MKDINLITGNYTRIVGQFRGNFEAISFHVHAWWGKEKLLAGLTLEHSSASNTRYRVSWSRLPGLRSGKTNHRNATRARRSSGKDVYPFTRSTDGVT